MSIKEINTAKTVGANITDTKMYFVDYEPDRPIDNIQDQAMYLTAVCGSRLLIFLIFNYQETATP